MDAMLLVLIAVGAAAIVAALVFLRLRPRGGDLNSVRSYHSALGTLEHLADRSGGSHVNVVRPTGEQAGSRVRPQSSPDAGAGREVPPIPVRGNDEFPDPETPLVFDDARPVDRNLTQPPSRGAGPPGVDRAHRHALESMNRRPRRITAVAVSVAVLVIFAALAYTGSRHSASAGHTHRSGSSTDASSASQITEASSSPVSRTIQRRGAAAHRRKRPSGSTATVPSRIVAVSTSGATATYSVITDSYRLSITASGPCWVLARSATPDATLWTGTLQAGASQVITATGTTTLELGAPSVLVTVNKVPVVFPTPFRTPFEAVFQPAGSGAASSGTPSPSSSPSPSPTTTTTTTGPTG
jgi:hypothetical protein